MADVIAAVATGRQPCAVGVLRLSGDGCAALTEKLFVPLSGRPLREAPDRKLVLGTLYDGKGREIDRCLAVYARGPRSYTGEDTVELQCHGSPAVLAAALEALLRAGARSAEPGEFTKRAFLNGKMDLTGAEAVIDLIEAQTADMAANAAAQVGGALHRRIDPIYWGITDLCSHYHAVLDYPDEEIPAFRLSDFEAQLRTDREQLEWLAATCERGRILKQGVRIALVGKGRRPLDRHGIRRGGPLDPGHHPGHRGGAGPLWPGPGPDHRYRRHPQDGGPGGGPGRGALPGRCGAGGSGDFRLRRGPAPG